MRVAPDEARNPGESAHLASKGLGPHNYGCQFIEFDGRGDFLEYQQFKDAQREIDTLSAKSNVLLVIYCHGWQNNTQSGDVWRFSSFLRRLAASPSVQAKGMHVHGIYLGWRGSSFFPVLSRNDRVQDAQIVKDFGGAPTNPRWQTPEALGFATAVPRVLSYYAIKERAEFYASRVPLAWAVFDLSSRLKKPQERRRFPNEVFVIGHSFGALMLEQSIGQGSVGLLTSNWTNGPDEKARWPFDLIVFLNSAAPSLYAKQMTDLLAEDRRRSAKPLIVSLTSKTDRATGWAHPLGNLFTKHAVDLRRRYKLNQANGRPVTVTAGQYYALTPGNNKYLINRAVVTAPLGTNPPSPDGDEIFAYNLDAKRTDPEFFYTRVMDRSTATVRRWHMRDISQEAPDEATRSMLKQIATNYWTATVPSEIISSHGDIWNDGCMQMLVGVYRLTKHLENQPPMTGPRSIRQN